MSPAGTINEQPIANRINWVFDLAQRYSIEFCSPEAFLARERYLALHRTAIAVLKCTDGRIDAPVATKTPAGIIQPFRNLGGIFDMGWPHLGEVLAQYPRRSLFSLIRFVSQYCLFFILLLTARLNVQTLVPLT